MNEERLSIEALVRDCKTISEKIRKAATAGHSTADIAKALSVRYQHVYKVRRDAGLLQSPRDGSSPTIPDRPAPTPSSKLLQSGFQEVGEWKLAHDGIATSAQAPKEPGVYAFVLDDTIVYVGSTARPLRTCMYQYRRGDIRQKTRARVRDLIKSALAAGKQMKILVASPGASEWNGLPVVTAAGLEVGLIRLIQPEWNIALRKANTVKRELERGDQYRKNKLREGRKKTFVLTTEQTDRLKRMLDEEIKKGSVLVNRPLLPK